MESTLECIGTGDHFLNIIPVAQTLRETINKWDFLNCEASVKQRHGQKQKMAVYRMGKYHQPYIGKRTDLQNIKRTQET